MLRSNRHCNTHPSFSHLLFPRASCTDPKAKSTSKLNLLAMTISRCTYHSKSV
jgi:hypothetical protein